MHMSALEIKLSAAKIVNPESMKMPPGQAIVPMGSGAISLGVACHPVCLVVRE